MEELRAEMRPALQSVGENREKAGSRAGRRAARCEECPVRLVEIACPGQTGRMNKTPETAAGQAAEYLDFHAHLPVQDDRTRVTVAEAAAI